LKRTSLLQPRSPISGNRKLWRACKPAAFLVTPCALPPSPYTLFSHLSLFVFFLLFPWSRARGLTRFEYCKLMVTPPPCTLVPLSCWRSGLSLLQTTPSIRHIPPFGTPSAAASADYPFFPLRFPPLRTRSAVLSKRIFVVRLALSGPNDTLLLNRESSLTSGSLNHAPFLSRRSFPSRYPWTIFLWWSKCLNPPHLVPFFSPRSLPQEELKHPLTDQFDTCLLLL